MTVPSQREKLLWVIEGPGYRIPYNVGPEDLVACCSVPEINLTKRQRKLLGETIEKEAFNINEEGWWLHINKLPGKQINMPDIDPEDLLIWNPVVEEHDGYEAENPDEFYVSFYLKTGNMVIEGPESIKMLFSWFASHMLNWLGNRHKPIDLWFIKLHPMPYRANWRQILLYWDRKLPPITVPGLPRPLKLCRYLPHMYHRMEDQFIQPEMLAINKEDGTIEWRVEVEEQGPWTDHIRTVELERRKIRGKEYMNGVLEHLKRRFIDAMKLYAKFLYGCKSAAPTFTLGSVEGRVVVLQEHKRRTQQSARSCPLPDPLPAGEVQDDGPGDVPGTNGKVLGLPHFQPQENDVRNPK